MERNKIQDSELRLMEYIWDAGEISAKHLARIAAESIGWNKNTTYTLIGRLIDKGAVERREPGFVCVPLVPRSQVQHGKARELVDRMFGGSVKTLFASFLASGGVSKAEAEELRSLIDAYEPEDE